MALRLFLIFITINFAYSQNYWQQHVDYQMDIDMNVEDFTFKGTQKIVYTNNSPDTLNKVYYHLFFNAFRPGSQMDVRSRTIKDPDRRVRDRIFNLSNEDYGVSGCFSYSTGATKVISWEKLGFREVKNLNC